MTYLMNDELDDWEKQQQELALLQLADPSLGAPSSFQAPAFEAPPHAEMAPLEIDNGPDWTDALGAGTTALAALADLGFNEGKGTGQILAAGGAFGQARSEQRLRQTQDALNYEEKRAQLDKSNRYNDYLFANMAQRGRQGDARIDQAGERAGVAKQNAGTKAAGEARQTRKEGRDTNPESAYRDAFADTLIKQGMATSSELNGLSYEQMKADYGAMARRFEIDHAEEKAGNTARGRIGAELEAAPQTNQVAADKAAGIEAATRPGYIERARAGAEAREGVTGNFADREDQQSQRRADKFRDETERTRPQIGLARSVEGVMKRYPGDKPGVGLWDSYKSNKISSEDAIIVKTALANMGDLVARVRTGAAAPPAEYERILEFVNGGTAATEKQFRVAWNATVSALKAELKQQAAFRDREARGILGGDADWSLGPLAQPPAVGPQTSSSMAPGQFDVPGFVPVVGSTRNSELPDIPGGAPGGMTNNYVGPTRPTGNDVPPSRGGTGPSLPRAQPNPDGTFTLPGGRRPYQAHEVQRLIQMGKLAPL